MYALEGFSRMSTNYACSGSVTWLSICLWITPLIPLGNKAYTVSLQKYVLLTLALLYIKHLNYI